MLNMAGALGIATSIDAIVASIANFAVESVQMAMAAESANVTLYAMAGGAGAATAAMDAMKAATHGTISNLDAAKAASLGLATGLFESVSDINKYAESIATLGKAFRGLDPGESIALFNRMIANRSIKLMDDFGISIAKVNARMQELGDTGQEAFQTAVMEEMLEVAGKLADTWETNVTSMQRVKAALDDMKTGLGELITRLLDVDAAANIMLGDPADNKLREEILAASNSAEEYTAAMKEAGLLGPGFQMSADLFAEIKGQASAAAAAVMDYTDATTGAAAAQQRMNADLGRAAGVIAQNKAALAEMAVTALDAYTTLIAATEAYIAALDAQAERQMAAMDAMQAYMEASDALAGVYEMATSQLDTFNLSAAEHRDLLFDLGLATGQLTEAEIAAAEAISQLSFAFANGAITAEAYVAALAEIQSGADAAAVAQDTLANSLVNLVNAEDRALEATSQLGAADMTPNAEGLDELPSTLSELEDWARQAADALAELPEEVKLAVMSTAGEVALEVQDLITAVSEAGGLLATAYEAQYTAETEAAQAEIAEFIGGLSDQEYFIYWTHVETNSPPTGENGGSGRGGEQHGGRIPETRAYLVGERGPEMVWLPQGAHVTPASATTLALNHPVGGSTTAGGGAVIMNNVAIYMSVASDDPVKLLRMIEAEASRTGAEINLTGENVGAANTRNRRGL
jgi:hypothetical protein